MSSSWRYRDDKPGDLQFVTVKGVGGLPVFALREDVRYLLSLLAREVRAEELGIFCFAFVRNHAHFLFLSPNGAICRPLKRALERFAVYYNRTRGRTGHVFKDRFHSVCIRSDASLFCIVAYTDHNPVRAGLTELSTEYEFGSAASYVQDRSPPWLDRRQIAPFVPGHDSQTGQTPEDAYLRVFSKVDLGFVEEMIERRRHLERGLKDPLDTLLAPDRSRRIDWLIEQAQQADGTTGARLLAKATTLLEVVEQRSGLSDWTRIAGKRRTDDWRTMLIGLLRLGCARNCRQISAMLHIGPATVVRETRRHVDLLVQDRNYLEAAEGILTEAVRRTFAFLPPFSPVGPGGETRLLVGN